MKNRPSPCENCPFLRTTRPFLRVSRVREINWFVKQGGDFPCHKTTDHSDEAQERYIEEEVYYNTGKELRCAGGQILHHRMERPDDSEVYSTIFEMLQAYRANPMGL